MTNNQHNVEFFNDLNPTSCYWAGFIAADGYIYSPNGGIRIGLSRKDHKHIKKFKKAIRASYPVRKITTSNGYLASQIDLYGAYKCQEGLEKNFRVTTKKSKTLMPPLLENEEDVNHFIRGYMDGDGSISYNGSGRNNHWTVSFVGTLDMLLWIKEKIQQYVKGVGNPSVVPCKSAFQLIFGGWQTRPILEWLYKDSTEKTRLDRKYKKALEVFEFYPEQKRQYASQYRGVDFFKRTNKWKAEIKYKGQRHHLGYFNTEEEAALAYNDKARELGLHDRCYEVV